MNPYYFKTFALCRHLGEDSPAGDLAQDMLNDDAFPMTCDVDNVVDYINSISWACSNAKEAVAEVMVEYILFRSDLRCYQKDYGVVEDTCVCEQHDLCNYGEELMSYQDFKTFALCRHLTNDSNLKELAESLVYETAFPKTTDCEKVLKYCGGVSWFTGDTLDDVKEALHEYQEYCTLFKELKL